MFGLSRVPERRDAVTAEDLIAAARRMRSGGTTAPVTSGTVRALPSVSRSLSLVAGTASMMPLLEMQRTAGGEAIPVPTTSQLLANPSGEVPLEDWVWQHLDAMIVYGDAFGRIVARDAAMRPVQVEMVDPEVVSVRTGADGRRVTRFGSEVVPEGDVWHVAGRPRNAGPYGRGLLDVARDILAVGVSGREWARVWFEEGGSPAVVARQTGTPPAGEPGLADAGRATALKQKIVSTIRGNRDPLVIPGWIELDKWPAPTPTEAALVEVLRANSTDVAHHIGVPPELVGGVTGDSMTYANIEARMIDLLVFGVDYWLMKLERKLSRVTPGGRFARFDRQAVLRADAKAVAETLGLLVRSGLITQNEARDKLDRPRLDGGDVLLWPPMTTSAPAQGGTP